MHPQLPVQSFRIKICLSAQIINNLLVAVKTFYPFACRKSLSVRQLFDDALLLYFYVCVILQIEGFQQKKHVNFIKLNPVFLVNSQDTIKEYQMNNALHTKMCKKLRAKLTFSFQRLGLPLLFESKCYYLNSATLRLSRLLQPYWNSQFEHELLKNYSYSK